jgi:hypothetical protein
LEFGSYGATPQALGNAPQHAVAQQFVDAAHQSQIVRPR